MAASARCSKAFKQFVKLVPDTHRVGVAFKGGPDSLALLWLAKNTFKDVTAFTVDLKEIHPEGTEASSSSDSSSSSSGGGDGSAMVQQAGELAASIGVRHQVIPQSYSASISNRQFTANVRRKNYSAVLDECRKQNIQTLLIGHNMDDCLETTLSIIKTAGTVDSFSIFSPIHYYSSHTDIQVLRPLARCARTDILSLCQEEGLQWVAEDTASQTLRRKMLEDNPELREAVSSYAGDLQRVRNHLRRKVIEAFKEFATFSKYGYLTFRYSQFDSLPRAVLWRLLHLCNLCVSCSHSIPKMNVTRSVWAKLRASNAIQTSFKNCNIVSEGDRFAMVKRICKDQSPITPGQTVLWDKRWNITFQERPRLIGQKRYFVQAHRGKLKTPFRIKQKKRSVHPMVCDTLPVIVDDTSKLVFFPHLEEGKSSKEQELVAPWTVSYQPIIQVDQWGYLMT